MSRLFVIVLIGVLQAAAVAKDSPNRLRRIIVTTDDSEELRVGDEAIVFHQIQPPRPRQLRKALGPYIGTMPEERILSDLTQTIADHYAEHQIPVDVQVPDQSLFGDLLVHVTEATWNEIGLWTGENVPLDTIRKLVRLRPGDRVDGRQLDRQINWLNRHPKLEATAEVTEFEAGMTNLNLVVDDQRSVEFFTSYHNNGNELLGQTRLSAGFHWANALGGGHQWTAMTLMSDDPDQLLGYSTRYVHLLPWMHALELDAYYIETALLEPVLGSEIEGKSVGFSVNYRVPLVGNRAAGYSHELFVGMNYKRTDNDLVFGNLLSFSDTAIVQGRLNYEATLKDHWGATKFSLAWAYSPGELASANSDDAFGASHREADSNYHYGKASLDRIQALPWDFTFYAKGALQLSSERLLPTEQVSLGGARSIRAFDEHSELGDWGAWGTLEIRSPGVDLARGRFQGLAFVDAGVAGLKGEDNQQELVGAGLGARYQITDHLQGFLDYGWGLNRDSSEIHIGVSLRY